MKKTFWKLLREFSALRRPEGAGSRAGGFHETTILSEAAEKGDAGMEGVYLNRELSWLAFNGRVLEEAEREDVPLCERLGIFSPSIKEIWTNFLWCGWAPWWIRTCSLKASGRTKPI
ncbi:MAG: hypothetical protein V8R75_07145 [Oscillospiraceae bacterium]